MSEKNLFQNRKLRLCYFSTSAKTVNLASYGFEKRLGLLGAEVETVKVDGLTDPNLLPCDLLVVDAEKLPAQGLSKWLVGFGNSMEAQNKVWIPALILAKFSFSELAQGLAKAYQMNWYFDIVNPTELDSLPIRIANLLRIHDHLHELARYGQVLSELKQKSEGLIEKARLLGDKK